MAERKHPIPDAAEREPMVAPLVRWAKATGGIRSVTASVYQSDGSSISQTVDFFDPDEDEDA